MPAQIQSLVDMMIHVSHSDAKPQVWIQNPDR